MKRIGERVKRKRELLNLQLNDLAKKVGISSSALSQIEKAKAFPSINTLKLIADNLHTTVGELIGENETLSNFPVIKKDEMKFVEQNETGAEIFLLSHHDISKQMDTYFVRFQTGSDSSGLFTNHHGQHFCYIVTGEIHFSLDEKKYSLSKGDSMYFDYKNLHRFLNQSENITEILWIISPPSY